MTWKLYSSDHHVLEIIPSAVPDGDSRTGYSSALLINERLWIVPDGGAYSYMDALNRAEMIAMDLRHQAKQNPIVKGLTHAPIPTSK